MTQPTASGAGGAAGDRREAAGDGSPFRRGLTLWKLLRGESAYAFDDFYAIKRILLKYEGSSDYVNYGYWPRGAATRAPSAELVRLVAERLALAPDDILLDLGSGLGQPDVDIASSHAPARIIGVNLCAEQVEFANRKFERMGLADRIRHVAMSTDDVDVAFADSGITAVTCIEAIADIRDVERAIRNSARVLPPGGKIVICGEVRLVPRAAAWWKRWAGRALMSLTERFYTDSWRSADAYLAYLEAAGFGDLKCEAIGAAVYPPNREFSRGRRAALAELPGVSRLLKYAARAQLLALARLFEWGQIEYVVIGGRRRGGEPGAPG